MLWHLWRPPQLTKTSTSAQRTDLHKGVASIQVAQALSTPSKHPCRCVLAGNPARSRAQWRAGYPKAAHYGCDARNQIKAEHSRCFCCNTARWEGRHGPTSLCQGSEPSDTDTPALTSLRQGEDLGGAPRSPLDEAEEGEGEQGCCQACHQEPIGASSKKQADQPNYCHAHAIGDGHAEVVQEGMALMTVWNWLQHEQQCPQVMAGSAVATTLSSLTASGMSCGGSTGGLEMPAPEVKESCRAALRARMPRSV